MSEVTPLSTEEPKSTSAEVSMVKTFEEMQEWRRTRPIHRQYNIPDPMWEKIFALAKVHGANKVRQIFGISAKQFNAKLTEQTKKEQPIASPISPILEETSSIPSPSTPILPIDWCEALPCASPPKSSNPYDEVPIATHTLIVEFRRSDGKMMTIHTTTHRVGEIMQSFFNGI